jgi:hypothetical protein
MFDVIYLFIVILFCLATWGFLLLCESLMEAK